MNGVADVCATDGPVLADIRRSEADLVDWLDRCERLHRSRIQHDPLRCLICFGAP
jgi:hypothetical protein